MKSKISDYPEFLGAIQNNELVYLFGAGISSSLSDNQSCSWWQWIVNGIEYMKDTFYADTLNQSMKDDESTDNLIRVVGEVIKSTKADGTYQTWMRDSIEGASVSNHSLATTLKKLLITQDVFATTNYDLLLEQATGLATLSYEESEKAFTMLDHRKSDSVLHIHGVYDSANGLDNIVADKKQYETVLSDKGAQFIQQILGTRTLIFVGCGQTTEDGNISQFIQFAKKYLRMDVTYYFLYKSDRVPMGMPDNIELVPYGNEYSDLPLFLEDVAQERLRTIISRNRVVGISTYQQITSSVDAMIRYHFSQENVPFCGRDDELNELLNFIKSSVPFSWWSVTGQAGAGKSRMSLELLHRLPTGWFGFFLNDALSGRDIEAFIPFTDTVVVIDYVSGRESLVAEHIRRFIDLFAGTHYKLRMLLIERERNKQTGSWYAKLLQRFGKYDSIADYEYKDYLLYIEDLEDRAVEQFIGNVCSINGLPEDSERNKELRIAYGRKFEWLKYRPMYVQLFVEAWIFNDFSFPRYDSYEDLLRYALEREQEKWMSALDGDQECCNAFVRLIVRANISGSLNTNSIPELYKNDWRKIDTFIKNHSFPGKQRAEVKKTVIATICQNNGADTIAIVPMFPDIIKEYMFYYYFEEDSLEETMKEIWQNAAADFTIFITKCLTDFPDNAFFIKALNVYDDTTKDIDVLTGRLNVLKRWEIKEDDDPAVLYKLVWNEYEFWKSVTLPADNSEKKDMVGVLKVSGLNYVAKQFGGWTRYDLTDMMEAIDVLLAVEGGKATQLMKQFFLQEEITALSKSGFFDEATYLRSKADELLVINEEETSWDSMIHMQNRNAEMMEHILKNEFAEAYDVLLKMDEECNYSEIESVRVFAHSCFNMDNLAFMLDHTDYVGKGHDLVEKVGVLYPDDPAVQARIIGGVTSMLQYQFFDHRICDAELLEEIRKLEMQLSVLESDGDENTDDALNMSWGLLLTLKINAVKDNREELETLIGTADNILEVHEDFDSVAVAKIEAVTAMHEHVFHDKVSHAEVENAFKYVERNYNSNSLRDCFFRMLDKSENADSRENYMTKWVMYGARQGAAYDPLVGSGIPEVDYEEDILRELFKYTSQEPYKREHRKIGANEPCPCGSGKKFKRCCRGKGKYD